VVERISFGELMFDHKVMQTVTRVLTDDGAEGYYFGGHFHGDQDGLTPGDPALISRSYWYEHPMPEYRVDAYVRLADELTIPICSPETAEGGIYTRAEWIRRSASDISRIDVLRGGITGAMKMAATCEAFGLHCELHMSGFGNLQVLGATSEDVCEYYERGLLGPGVHYNAAPPYLKSPCDPMDGEGYVRVPQTPGLGYEIQWDYIDDRRLPDVDIEPLAPLHPR
jgi:L-alanine-DL-glutamate epimerase-like enolase superfamily enzyme